MNGWVSMNSPRPRSLSSAGFTLVELLVALALTLLIVGAALTAFLNAKKANDVAVQLLGMNEGLRAATDLMVRDLLQAGQGLPPGKVIDKPSGAGASAIHRPGPPGLSFAPGDVVFTAVTTGAGEGPAYRDPQGGTGPATDVFTIMQADTQFEGVLCKIAPNARVITVSPKAVAGGADISGPGVEDPLVAGDLLMLSGSEAAPNGSALVEITKVAGQSVHADADDPMLLNQLGAADGTVLQLLPTPAKATDALLTRIRMITYFLDNAVDPPRLMRQRNFGAARVVATGIDNLQVSYDIADGMTNPSNVKAPAVPNQIRKVNLYLAARSARRLPTGQYLRNAVATQVALRSLAFVDRYQ